MSVLYFDVFAGISGDMCLGALVDAGCPLDELKNHLSGLNLPGFDLTQEKIQRGVLAGTKIHVHVEEKQHVHRHLKDVIEIVDQISWPGNVRDKIETAFTYLAKAEGHVHGKDYDKVHFHEVGMYDAIIDISGTILGLHLLGVDEVYCSKVHVGEGFAYSAHGKVPVPVPATTYLLQGFDIYSTGRPMEMVTPTGATLLKTLAHCSSTIPNLNLKTIGYGAGSKETDDLPNMLRVMVGELTHKSTDRVIVIESNIDDMNPEFYEPLIENLFAVGALDVTLLPVMMKKSRPGQIISIITSPAHKEELAQLVLQHSSSIGVRFYECERRILQREQVEVSTTWGIIKGKVSWGHNIKKRFSPEFEQCRIIHQQTGVPIAEIYQAALIAYDQQQPQSKKQNQMNQSHDQHSHHHENRHDHHGHHHNHGHSHE